MLGRLIASTKPDLAFNVLEIGARPAGDVEPFHVLPAIFPSSRISALEIDPELCEELNRGARAGMRYYPCALGRADESRTLYETVHEMCASLYEPDERYADAFHNLDVMRLVETRQVRTVSLDAFVRDHALGPIDFIKMDIQGAELDVLEGGSRTLADVLAVVSEVEFVPLYKGQPLYGDVDAHLRGLGFTLHKFLGMSGRVMKPLALRGTGNYPVQMMWSDAVFTRDILGAQTLTEDQLLKLAMMLDLYDSKDAALHLVRRYDVLRGTALAPEYLGLIKASGVWSEENPVKR